jgi:hypothetical protein
MIFASTNPEKILQQQITEAKRIHLEHAAAAEYHQAIAQMAKQRLVRLKELEETPE